MNYDTILWIISGIIIIGILVYSILIYKKATKEDETCRDDPCITNIYTGKKTCGDNLVPDISNVCNSRRTCSNPRAPYLYYNPEIGTVPNGICPENIPDSQCFCLPSQVCPTIISTFFVENRASVYGNSIQSGATPTTTRFVMKDSYTDPIILTAQSRNRPLAISAGTVPETCYVNKDNFNLIEPRNLTRENRCLTGRLIYQPTTQLFSCITKDKSFEELICDQPNVLVADINFNVSCMLIF